MEVMMSSNQKYFASYECKSMHIEFRTPKAKRIELRCPETVLFLRRNASTRPLTCRTWRSRCPPPVTTGTVTACYLNSFTEVTKATHPVPMEMHRAFTFTQRVDTVMQMKCRTLIMGPRMRSTLSRERTHTAEKDIDSIP